MKPTLSPLIFGKLPPQALELEEAVLGAIMLESECLASVLEIITTPEVFYSDANQKIYGCVMELNGKGDKVDLLTITDALNKKGLIQSLEGGAYYITKLTQAVVSSAHVVYHAAAVLYHYKLREIIRIAGVAMNAAYDTEAEPDAICSEMHSELAAIMEAGSGDTVVHVSYPAAECLEQTEKAMNNPGMLTGVDTGYRELNAVTNGWQRQNVIIIPARPSQGKTALAINLILNAGVPSLFFSLEMSKHEVTNRMLSAISGVPLEDIQKGTCSSTQLQELYAAKNALDRSGIHIDDKAGLSTINLLSRTRRWKRKKDIRLVVIDYLQLMHVPDAKGKSREAQVAEISRGIKLTAKECDLPIIPLSQMNRDIEKAKRRPTLSDIRESGAIEQDADVVAFIWHEEDGNTGQIRNKIVVAKNRQGKTEDVELKFLPSTQKWISLDTDVFSAAPNFNPYAGISKQASLINEDPF